MRHNGEGWGPCSGFGQGGIHIVFFYWRIFAKSLPEKCDFDQYKGFFIGKMVQIRQISKKKEKFKSPYFDIKFQ